MNEEWDINPCFNTDHYSVIGRIKTQLAKQEHQDNTAKYSLPPNEEQLHNYNEHIKMHMKDKQGIDELKRIIKQAKTQNFDKNPKNLNNNTWQNKPVTVSPTETKHMITLSSMKSKTWHNKSEQQ